MEVRDGIDTSAANDIEGTPRTSALRDGGRKVPTIALKLPTEAVPAGLKAPAEAPPVEAGKAGAGNKFKKYKKFIIPIGVIALGLLGHWVYTLFTTESTDDAFVTDHVHIIGARVAGTVIDIPVVDNQIVKKGDVLFRLDPHDYDIAEKIAKANAIKAHNDLSRWNEHEYLHPNEQLQRSSDIAAALTADATLQQADLNLAYTTIVAPTDGKVGNRVVETGQQVQVGQAQMALVEQTPWVVANFKESQVTHLRVGQKVDMEVDAIKDHAFVGHIDSLAPGSGATFALLPPDNATGNFTKIVQRIPVKIVIDAASIKGYENRLAPGMSVEVTVDTK